MSEHHERVSQVANWRKRAGQGRGQLRSETVNARLAEYTHELKRVENKWLTW